MGKIKASERDIADFHERLTAIITNEPPLEVARGLLKKYHPDALAGILEEYHNGSLVFESLIVEEKSSLMPLMIDFLNINSDILTKPLKEKKGTIHGNTALTFFIETQAAYPKIYSWIKKNALQTLRNEKKRMDMLETLHNEVIAYIKEQDFSNFEILLNEILLETRIELLTLYDYDILIKELLKPKNLAFLMFILDSDVRALRVTLEGETILERISRKPVYQPALYLVAQKHMSALSDEEQQMLPELSVEEIAHFPALARGSFEDKYASILLLLNSRPTQLPLLTLPHLSALLPAFDMALQPYVNTKLSIEKPILDAFLFQTCWEELDARGIALMPLVESDKPIDPEQLLAIFDGGYAYTIGLELSAHGVKPIRAQVSSERKNITHAVWPVNIDNRYGLFILDLTRTDVPYAGHGVYIEPRSLSKLIQSADFLQSEVALHPFTYQHYIKRLSQHLQMDSDDLTCIFLAQNLEENSSDYVVAVLMLLASGKIDLVKQPDVLKSLQGRYLDESTIQIIRMCQIQTFGKEYLKLQLAPEHRNPDVISHIDTTALTAQQDVSKYTSDRDTGEPDRKRPCVSPLSMFTGTSKRVVAPPTSMAVDKPSFS